MNGEILGSSRDPQILFRPSLRSGEAMSHLGAAYVGGTWDASSWPPESPTVLGTLGAKAGQGLCACAGQMGTS